MKTWAQVESRGHGSKNNSLMVSDWSLTKHNLESWKQAAFALRKETAAKPSKKTAQQLNKAPAAAWENNIPAPLHAVASSKGGGGGLGTV